MHVNVRGSSWLHLGDWRGRPVDEEPHDPEPAEKPCDEGTGVEKDRRQAQGEAVDDAEAVVKRHGVKVLAGRRPTRKLRIDGANQLR